MQQGRDHMSLDTTDARVDMLAVAEELVLQAATLGT